LSRSKIICDSGYIKFVDYTNSKSTQPNGEYREETPRKDHPFAVFSFPGQEKKSDLRNNVSKSKGKDPQMLLEFISDVQPKC
jgi:hypothetical protein